MLSSGGGRGGGGRGEGGGSPTYISHVNKCSQNDFGMSTDVFTSRPTLFSLKSLCMAGGHSPLRDKLYGDLAVRACGGQLQLRSELYTGSPLPVTVKERMNAHTPFFLPPPQRDLGFARLIRRTRHSDRSRTLKLREVGEKRVSKKKLRFEPATSL